MPPSADHSHRLRATDAARTHVAKMRPYLTDKVEQARHIAVAPAQQLCRLLAQLVELAHRAERERAKRERAERERARRKELKVACRWRSPSSSCTARATSPMRHGYSRGPVRFAAEPLSNLDGSVWCAPQHATLCCNQVYIVATAAVGILLKSEIMTRSTTHGRITGIRPGVRRSERARQQHRYHIRHETYRFFAFFPDCEAASTPGEERGRISGWTEPFARSCANSPSGFFPT